MYVLRWFVENKVFLLRDKDISEFSDKAKKIIRYRIDK